MNLIIKSTGLTNADGCFFVLRERDRSLATRGKQRSRANLKKVLWEREERNERKKNEADRKIKMEFEVNAYLGPV